ncbi:hypothetical protein E8L99_14130 [Phreatobacter aquaticus]|uniref:Uncharacterized protein n=1 Tax=Phreatobacter aquaticus TaxID=2570229 RepID=A0A4D7QFV8_9HYPH|nr:hypothetical protein [Phreatobacter aquaticus]QCK86810.1 hypothetical protein E8L99_14130 [Phreatobacter aquaticus]
MVETRDRPLSLSYRRPADRQETRVLEDARGELHHDTNGDLAEVASGLSYGFATLLVVGPLALLIAWLLQFATGMSFGSERVWFTAAGLWLTAWGGLGAIRVAARRTRVSMLRRALDDDIEAREVVEESWRFVEAIGFQEAEKMPLLYMVHADNGGVVAFEERHLLGRERSPGESAISLAPSDAVLVRGPRSGLLISENYSGPPLPLLDVHTLTRPRDERPAHGSVIDRPWKGVHAWLAGPH